MVLGVVWGTVLSVVPHHLPAARPVQQLYVACVHAFVNGLPSALPLPAGQGNIYQSIFLDDQQSQHWTVGEIDSDSVLKRRVTRQVGCVWAACGPDRYIQCWVVL